MINSLKIAKKEFADILNSNVVLIILAFYLFLFIFSYIYSFQYKSDKNSIQMLFILFLYMSCYYNTLVAMAIGYSSFFLETSGNAINTILTKPVYRDTIIYGKFINAFLISTGLFLFTTFLYIVAALISFNDPLNVILKIFNILPLLFLLSVLCFMFFYSLTMLFSILIKDETLSLFTSLLSWIIIFYIFDSNWFAGYLSYFFHSRELEHTISSLSPFSLVNSVISSNDAITSLLFNGNLDIIKLLLYMVITMALTLIAFTRRDIS